MLRTGIVEVTALIDWNSQIYNASPGEVDEVELAKRTLLYVGRYIGRLLNGKGDKFRFAVNLRLYHGWLKGFEPTSRRKAVRNALAEIDFAALSEKANVSIKPDVEFGHKLVSAKSDRLHVKLDCHLPNTLRKVNGAQDLTEEKLVDTALAADLVDLAHRDSGQWLVVMGEDDDLIAPVYVAEAVLAEKGKGGCVMFARRRKSEKFYYLENVWCEL